MSSEPVMDSPTGRMRRTVLAPALITLSASRRCRQLSLRLALRLEGGDFYSTTARRILHDHYRVDIEKYSYGACFTPGAFAPGTRVGPYCSIGPNVRTYARNHPSDRLSTHPFFYNHHLGFVDQDTITTGDLAIGPDVWIGADAIITPGCRCIGLGAIVGAGAVVARDVPPFAVAVGNPAQVKRYRFDEPVRELISASAWWTRPVDELVAHLDSMIASLPNPASAHPLLKHASARRPIAV